MAVGIVMEFEGTTLQQYDEVMEQMGLSPDSDGPAGLILHWVTAIDNGIRITDVWEAPEQFEAFAAESIRPSVAAVGIVGEPTIAFHEIHNQMSGA